MPEHPTFSRKANLADFLDDMENNSKSSKRGQNSSREDTIAKNQQEFGHKKRIKP